MDVFEIKKSISENIKFLESNRDFYPIKFDHLRDHNGFRRGMLHVLVGMKGGGKSTLNREWISLMLRLGKKVLVCLSEEVSEHYKAILFNSLGDDMLKYWDSIFFLSEKETAFKNPQYFISYIDSMVMENGIEILFYDNITTSEISRYRLSDQENFVMELGKIASFREIPVIILAHTQKAFNGRSIIKGENVRGIATAVNTAPYVYTLTIFHDLPQKPTVLFVDKARHHSGSNKAYYLLAYEKGSYVADQKLSGMQLVQLMEAIKNYGK